MIMVFGVALKSIFARSQDGLAVRPPALDRQQNTYTQAGSVSGHNSGSIEDRPSLEHAMLR